MTTHFLSNDHIRFENGKDVSGHNKGCKREIVITPNNNYEGAYTVSIWNLDSFPKSESMAPKRMKVNSQTSDKIEFVGFGTDSLGFSFADYALTLYLYNGQVKSAKLHMLDREIAITYLYDRSIEEQKPSIILIAEMGLQHIESRDYEKAMETCVELVKMFANDISCLDKFDLKSIGDLRKIGSLFFKTTQKIEKNSFQDYQSVFLCAFLINIIDYKISSGNESTVESRILMVNKQPNLFKGFIQSVIMPQMKSTIINESNLEMLSVKLYWLLEAEILGTSFLKDRPNLKPLYTHYKAELDEGTFSPLTTKAEIIAAKNTLLNLFESELRKYLVSSEEQKLR